MKRPPPEASGFPDSPHNAPRFATCGRFSLSGRFFYGVGKGRHVGQRRVCGIHRNFYRYLRLSTNDLMSTKPRLMDVAFTQRWPSKRPR